VADHRERAPPSRLGHDFGPARTLVRLFSCFDHRHLRPHSFVVSRPQGNLRESNVTQL
jgi:hypothetical protein